MAQTIGFLSVRRHAEHGFFGGYLIVNHLARPLEFHCTLPVKPTRAQELLYGPTIDDFVCGEQIAKALVTKAKLKPELVLTDCPAVLALGHVSEVPVAVVDSVADGASADDSLRTPQSRLQTSSVRRGDIRLQIAAAGELTQDSLLQKLETLGTRFDLGEPFQRVVEALLEAHPIVKAA